MKQLREKLSRINEALPGLLLGIFFWGMLCQIVLVWFLKDKAGYSFGLWIGVMTAFVMAWHMAWSLDRALDFGEDGATKVMTKHNMIRYGIVLIIEGIVMVTGAANPLATFLGIMGLKVAAYLQPITHKLFRR